MRWRLIFTTAPGIISWFIRKVSGGKVSHVGIQVAENTMWSAEGDGVKAHSLVSFLKGRRIVCVFEATEEGQKHIENGSARAFLGNTPYAFGELPGAAVAEIKQRLGDKDAKNSMHDPHRMFCSEFALKLDDETGFSTEFTDMDGETTSPQDLVNALRKGGPTFVETSWRPDMKALAKA